MAQRADHHLGGPGLALPGRINSLLRRGLSSATPQVERKAALEQCLHILRSLPGPRWQAAVQELLPAWSTLVGALFDQHAATAQAAAQLLGTAGALLWCSAQLAAQPPTNPSSASATSSSRRRGGSSSSGPGRRVSRGRSAAAAAGPQADSRAAEAAAAGPPAELVLDWLLPLLGRSTSLPGCGLASPAVQAVICKGLAVFCSTAMACCGRPCATHSTRSMHSTPPAAPASLHPQVAAPAQGPPSEAAAAALSSACQRIAAQAVLLLDSADTGPQLLQPLLPLLLCLLEACPDCVQGQLQDLVDILLGWCLDPEVTATDRRLVHLVFSACHSSWRQQPALARQVLDKLLQDVQGFVQHLPAVAPPPPQARVAPAESAVAASAAGPSTGGEAGTSAGAAADPEQIMQPQQPVERHKQQEQRFLVLVGCTAAITAAVLRAASPGPQQETVQRQAAALCQLLRDGLVGFVHLEQDASACEAAACLAGHWLDTAAAFAGCVGGAAAGMDSAGSRGAHHELSTGSSTADWHSLTAAVSAAVSVLQLQALPQAAAQQLLQGLSRVLLDRVLAGDAVLLSQMEEVVSPLVGSVSTERWVFGPGVLSAVCAFTAACLSGGLAAGEELLGALLQRARDPSSAAVQPGTLVEVQQGKAATQEQHEEQPGQKEEQAQEQQQPSQQEQVEEKQQQQQQPQAASQNDATQRPAVVLGAGRKHPVIMTPDMVLQLVLQQLLTTAQLCSPAGSAQPSDVDTTGSVTVTEAGAAAAIRNTLHATGLAVGKLSCSQSPAAACCASNLLLALMQLLWRAADAPHQQQQRQMLARAQAIASSSCEDSSSSTSTTTHLSPAAAGDDCTGLPEQAITAELLQQVAELLHRAWGDCSAAQQVQQKGKQQQQLADTASSLLSGVLKRPLSNTARPAQQLLDLLLRAAAVSVPEVRLAAVRGLEDLLQVLLQTPSTQPRSATPAVSEMQQVLLVVASSVLLERSSDVAQKVATAAVAAVHGAAPGLLCCCVLRGAPRPPPGAGEAATTWEQLPRSLLLKSIHPQMWQLAQQPQKLQQRAFSTTQISDIFNVLFQVLRPADASASNPTQQAGSWYEQLLRLSGLGEPGTTISAPGSAPQSGKAVSSSRNSGLVAPTASASAAHATPPAVLAGSTPGSIAAPSSNSFMSAVLQLLQELARHCVASKMHTHWGGATQTFSSLEQLLQRALAALQQRHTGQAEQIPGGQPAATSGMAAAAGTEGGVADAAAAEAAAAAAAQPSAKETAVLLLDFMLALEYEVALASEGSCSGAAPRGSCLVFFTANKKVCQEWFLRVRPVLLQISVASAEWHLVMHHGTALLLEGKQQLRALQHLAQQLHRQLKRLKQQQQQQPAATDMPVAAAAGGSRSHTSRSSSSKASSTSAAQPAGLKLMVAAPQPTSSGVTPSEAARMPGAAGAAAAGSPQHTGPADTDAAADAIHKQLLQQVAAICQLCLKLGDLMVLLAEACIELRDAGAAAGLYGWAAGTLLPAASVAQQLMQQQQQQRADPLVQQRSSGGGSSSTATGGKQQSASGGSSFAGLKQRQPAPGSSSSMGGSTSSSKEAAFGPEQLLWLAGVVAQSAGRFEAAAHLYEQHIASAAAQVGFGRAAGDLALRQLAACYAAVADRPRLQQLGQVLLARYLAKVPDGPTIPDPAAAAGAVGRSAQLAAQPAAWLQQGGASEGPPSLLTRSTRLAASTAVLGSWAGGWELAGAAGYSQLSAWDRQQQQHQQQQVMPPGSITGSSSVFTCLTEAQQLLLEGLAVWQQPEGPATTLMPLSWGFDAPTPGFGAAGVLPSPAAADSTQSHSSRGRGRDRGRGRGYLADGAAAAAAELPEGTRQHILQLLDRAAQLPWQLLGSYNGARALWLGQGAAVEQLGELAAVEQLLQRMLGRVSAGAGAGETAAAGWVLASAAGVREHGTTSACLADWVQSWSRQVLLPGLQYSSGDGGAMRDQRSMLIQQLLTAGGDVLGTGPLELPQLLRLLQLLQAEARPPAVVGASSSHTAGSGSNSTQAERQLLLLSLLAAEQGGCGNTAAALMRSVDALITGSQAKQALKVLQVRLEAAGGGVSSHPLLVQAVQQHVQVLADFQQLLMSSTTPQQLPGDALATGSSSSSDARHADGAAPAASRLLLSLAQLVHNAQTQGGSPSPGAAAVAAQVQACLAEGSIDWQNILRTSLAACMSHVDTHVPTAAGGALPEQLVAAAALAGRQQLGTQLLSCYAGAAAAAPSEPQAWRQLGHFLWSLSCSSSSSSTGESRDTPHGLNSPPQQPAKTKKAHGRTAASTAWLSQVAAGSSEAHCLGLAAGAYCNFLAAGARSKWLATAEKGMDALLRLLQLVLHCADVLPLQDLLGSCPAAAWQVLAPQLMGQLMAPGQAPAVKDVLVMLLRAVAVAEPCAVLYRVVLEVRVAAVAGQPSPYVLQPIIQQLQLQHPQLLADTLAMADSLETLTVTVQERWSSLLSELEVETGRQLLNLQAALSRVGTAAAASGAAPRRAAMLTSRYQTVMARIIQVLQQHIAAAAAAVPASPAETAFQQQLLPQVQAALQHLQQPPAQLLAAPDEGGVAAGELSALVWGPFKVVQQQLDRQLRNSTLELAQVAPRLAALRDTTIPLPSHEANTGSLPLTTCSGALAHPTSSGPSSSTSSSRVSRAPSSSSAGVSWVSISAFSPTALALSTKTRPKRVRLLASDGSVHTFLLKGRDDLRMDERIMQLLRTVNVLLAEPLPRNYSHSSYSPAAGMDLELPLLQAASMQELGGEQMAAGGVPPADVLPSSVTGTAAQQLLHSSSSGYLRLAAPGAAALHVRGYSVTPLGPRAGLVQWVRKTISLFGVVRAWQAAAKDRYAALHAAKQEAAAAAAANAAAVATAAAAEAAAATVAAAKSKAAAAAVTAAAAAKKAAAAAAQLQQETVRLPLLVGAKRPADAFYARLLPALQQVGIPAGAARKNWPHEVVRGTLQVLVKEAPVQLLARELLLAAGTATGWWQHKQHYTLTAAASSMVGYLIGLGDRHLDNLLLERGSGELVHIDYNVVWDKGQQLRVPEVVPFRLTGVMQAALGATSYEGTFKAACEAVLHCLRHHAPFLESLLATLLEDPAVDWSADREVHVARKDVDTSISLSLLVSRWEELRGPLLSSLQQQLPAIGNALQVLVAFGEAHVYMLRQYRATEAAKQQIASAEQRLLEAQAAQEAAAVGRAQAAAAAAERSSDVHRLSNAAVTHILSPCRSWLERHSQTLSQLVPSPSPVLASPPEVWSSVDSPVALWLMSAAEAAEAAAAGPGGAAHGGVLEAALGHLVTSDLVSPELVTALQAADQQGRVLLRQRDDQLMHGMTSLLQYSLVLKELLPGMYLRDSHHQKWLTSITLALAATDQQQLSAAAAAAPQAPNTAAAVQDWCRSTCSYQLLQSQVQTLQRQLDGSSNPAAGSRGPRLAGAGADASWSSSELALALAGVAGQWLGEEVPAAKAQMALCAALGALCQDVAQAAAAASCADRSLCSVASEAEGRGQLPDSRATPASAGPALLGPAALPGNRMQQQQPGEEEVPPLKQQCSSWQEATKQLLLGLHGLQGVLSALSGAGLGDVVDLGCNSGELPDAELDLEALLSTGDDAALEEALAAQRGQGQPAHSEWLQQQQGQLQLLQQLFLAADCEVLPVLLPWASGGESSAANADRQPAAAAETPREADPPSEQLAGAAAAAQQVQLFEAAAEVIQQGCGQLHATLTAAAELQRQMRAVMTGSLGTTAAPASDQQQQVFTLEALQQQWAALDAAMLAACSSSLSELLGVTDPDLLQQLVLTLEQAPDQILQTIQHWSCEVAFLNWGAPAAPDVWGSVVLLLVAAAGAGAAIYEQQASMSVAAPSAAAAPSGAAAPAAVGAASSPEEAAAAFARTWGHPEQLQQLPLDFSSKYGTQVLVLSAMQQLVQVLRDSPATAASVGVDAAATDSSTTSSGSVEDKGDANALGVSAAAATAASAGASKVSVVGATVMHWLHSTIADWVLQPIGQGVHQYLAQLQQHLLELEQEGKDVLQRATGTRTAAPPPPLPAVPAAAAAAAGAAAGAGAGAGAADNGSQEAVGNSREAQRQWVLEETTAGTDAAGGASGDGPDTIAAAGVLAGEAEGLLDPAGLSPPAAAGDGLAEGAWLERDLVAFTGFDPELAGADILLEEELEPLEPLEGTLEGLRDTATSQGSSRSSSSDSSQPGGRSGSTAAAGHISGCRAGEMELVAFMDFDMDLPGADMLLESEPSDAGDALEDQAASAATGVVAAGDAMGALEGARTGAGIVEPASAEEAEEEVATGLGSQGTLAVAGSSLMASSPAAAAAGIANTTQELLGLMQAVLQDHGTGAVAAGLQPLLEAAAGAAQVLRQRWLRHAAALEWRCEEQLTSAAGAAKPAATGVQPAAAGAGAGEPGLAGAEGPALAAASLLCDGLQPVAEQLAAAVAALCKAASKAAAGDSDAARSGCRLEAFTVGTCYQLFAQATAGATAGVPLPSRQQLLLTWKEAVQQLGSIHTGLDSWQECCADLMKQLHAQLLQQEGGQQQLPTDPRMALQALKALLLQRQGWLDGAAAVSEEVSRLAEAAVQLEYSRQGRLWVPGGADVDPFQGHPAMLEQLLAASSALLAVQLQQVAAEAAILQQQAAAAAAVSEQKQAEADREAAMGELLAKGPALMARFKAAAGQIGGLTAATSALLAAGPISGDNASGGSSSSSTGSKKGTSSSSGIGAAAGGESAASRAPGATTTTSSSSAAGEAAASSAAAAPQPTGGQLLAELHSMLSELRALSEQGSAAHDLSPLTVAAQQQYDRGTAALRCARDLAEMMAAEVALMPEGPLSHLVGCTAEQYGKQEVHWMSAVLEQLEPMVTQLQQQVAELGQTHVTFTHLMHQVDSTTGAASMVAAALQAEHAAPPSSISSSAWGAVGPSTAAEAAAGGGAIEVGGEAEAASGEAADSSTGGSSSHGASKPSGSRSGAGSGASASSSSRAAKAQARRGAFIRGALARCSARLQGRRHTASSSQAQGGSPGDARQLQQEQLAQGGVLPVYTVHEQVQRVVAAAVSLDNLARMYEGWTPWL